MDTLDFIMAYEGGQLTSEEQVVEGFQALIDSGLVWQLQGSYGRAARDLIDSGRCHRAGEGTRSFGEPGHV